MPPDEALPVAPRAIDQTDDLYRRIHPDWITDDKLNPGKKRLSSAAFRPPHGSSCSGYVARECTIEDVLGEHKFNAVGAITVSHLTCRGYQIERDVEPGEHPSHVHL